MNNAIWVGGEGYVAGDVISVGGGTSATITTMPTFEFKVSLPGGIAGAYWQAMTGANLAAAIPALGATYDPNDGFDMQVRIIANQTNVGAFLLQLRLQTNNLTTYRAKDTYFAITGCDLTDVVELRLVATDALVASRTGNGVLGFEGAPVFRKAAYLTRKTAGGDLLQTTISSPATLDVSNNGVVSLASFNIVVTGVGLADTIEMRNVADNTLRASRVGPGAFVILPADDGVAVYFERKVGGVLVMSTAFAPTTLQAGPNADVPLFVGAQVQVAQAPIIDTLPGKLDVLRRMVSKASKVIPTNEQFPA
jgi:hypothetical protein